MKRPRGGPAPPVLQLRLARAGQVRVQSPTRRPPARGAPPSSVPAPHRRPPAPGPDAGKGKHGAGAPTLRRAAGTSAGRARPPPTAPEGPAPRETRRARCARGARRPRRSARWSTGRASPSPGPRRRARRPRGPGAGDRARARSRRAPRCASRLPQRSPSRLPATAGTSLPPTRGAALHRPHPSPQRRDGRPRRPAAAPVGATGAETYPYELHMTGAGTGWAFGADRQGPGCSALRMGASPGPGPAGGGRVEPRVLGGA